MPLHRHKGSIHAFNLEVERQLCTGERIGPGRRRFLRTTTMRRVQYNDFAMYGFKKSVDDVFKPDHVSASARRYELHRVYKV